MCIRDRDTTEQYRELFIPKIVKIEQNLAFREITGPVNQTDIAGNRQGIWINTYPNGIIESEIFFKDNHPAGIFRKYYENGNLKANMHFDETGIKAAAILYDEKGSKISMGYYYNKQKDSLWQYFLNDSIVVMEENYRKGVKHGYERTYNPYNYPKVLDEKFWENDVQVGLWTRYYLDGKPKAITEYKNGIKEGKYVAFNESGSTIVTGTYKNNLFEGKWQIWNEELQKIEIIEYKDGRPINEEQLSEEETRVLKQLEAMKGKFIEPDQQMKENYFDH